MLSCFVLSCRKQPVGNKMFSSKQQQQQATAAFDASRCCPRSVTDRWAKGKGSKEDWKGARKQTEANKTWFSQGFHVFSFFGIRRSAVLSLCPCTASVFFEGLLHKAHIFVLRSYLALSERDPQIRQGQGPRMEKRIFMISS